MNRPHCFQYLGGSRWRSVQAVNFFLSREDSMVNSGYAGPSGCAVSSFSMKSCRAAPGSGCFIKFSPIRKPWNPAERSCRTVRGSERPLSEILTKRSGMRPPSSNERAGSVRKELRSRLLIPATSTSSQRCPSSCSLWISSSTSSPSARAYPASDRTLAGVSAAAISRTTSAPAIRASQIWYGSMIKSLRRIGIDRFLRAGIRSSRQPAK